MIPDKFLSSPDKLDWRVVLQIVALILVFSAGWFLSGQFHVKHAHDHYRERIRGLLEESDPKQLSRTYAQGHTDHYKDEWNDEFAKIHFFLLRSDQDRCDTGKIIREAIIHPESPVPIALQGFTADHLLQSHRDARKMGLYRTVGQRNALYLGFRPNIEDGKRKVNVEIDHIIPSSVIPQISQLLLNLRCMKEGENIGKSDEPTPEAKQLLVRLIAMDVVTPDMVYQNLKQMKRQGTAAEWKTVLDQVKVELR